MYDYETSEQLFIDIWKKYGSPDEVDDADIIFNILNDLVTKTSHTLNGIRTLKIQQYRQLNSKLSHGS